MNVQITKEQALKIGSRKYGITSGKKVNGIRPTIYFCSLSVFLSYFPELEYRIIEI